MGNRCQLTVAIDRDHGPAAFIRQAIAICITGKGVDVIVLTESQTIDQLTGGSADPGSRSLPFDGLCSEIVLLSRLNRRQPTALCLGMGSRLLESATVFYVGKLVRLKQPLMYLMIIHVVPQAIAT